jgi:hypothetical protein
MASRNKFDTRIISTGKGRWSAQVICRRSTMPNTGRKGTTIEIEKKGFRTEEAAKTWAVNTLAEYLTERKESALRRREHTKGTKEYHLANENRRALKKELNQASCTALAELIEIDPDHTDINLYKDKLAKRCRNLQNDLAFRLMGDSDTAEDEAFEKAYKVIGLDEEAWVINSRDGFIDQLYKMVKDSRITQNQLIAFINHRLDGEQ